MAQLLSMFDAPKRRRGRPADPNLRELKARAYFWRNLAGLPVAKIADRLGRSTRQIYAWIREAAQFPECQGISRQSKAG